MCFEYPLNIYQYFKYLNLIIFNLTYRMLNNKSFNMGSSNLNMELEEIMMKEGSWEITWGKSFICRKEEINKGKWIDCISHLD